MHHKLMILAVIAALTGCGQSRMVPPTARIPVTQADAAKIADDTATVWRTTDAVKIKALYASDITGFNIAAAPLIVNRADWDRSIEEYALANIDGMQLIGRKIQLLGDNDFVVSQSGRITSSKNARNNSTVRCTDVFEKGVDGNWLIVNEHCSLPPKSPFQNGHG